VATGGAFGRRRREDDLAFETVAALGRLGGDSAVFFDQCLQILAESADADLAGIDVFAEASDSRLVSLATWRRDGSGQTLAYALSGSPSAEALAREQLVIPADAHLFYPACGWMTNEKVSGYFGQAVRDADGVRLGVLWVAATGPSSADALMSRVMPVFAERIAAEIGRQRERAGLTLAASLFEHSPRAVMISDARRRILSVNPAFTRITGWPPEAVRGRRDEMLSAGRDGPGLRAEIDAKLANEGAWVGELWSRRSDGEVFPEHRTIVAVRDASGHIIHHLNTFTDISAEKFAAERIHRLAHFDATTELPNRVLLQDRLLNAINRASRANGRLALLFLDLDGFKLINDTFGHSAGDEVLRIVGERLTSRLRKADVVARIGGDEFAVVLSEVGADSDIQGLCGELLSVITEPYPLGGQTGHVSTSIGIAVFPEDGTDVPTLLKHADAAMYQAKTNGKNRYAFYEPEMNRRAEERLQLTRQLRQALDHDQFSLCYQPQFDLASGALVGVEALLRWRDENGHMVEPTRFIPLAEDSGLIVALGSWALEEACRQAQQWRAQGLSFGRLAVNISGRQFQGEGLREVVAAALEKSGLPGELLELEITETWVMEGPFKAEKQMRALCEMGVNLVIDDFGVANSSMAYLKRFPVQKLKIDRSFIRDIPADNDDAAIVSAIIAMGHSLGLRVLAEGVETAEQSAFLRGTGCDEAQGYLFGRPVPSDEMNVLLLYGPSLGAG
jgi:diguanylate cyclase (GGDEF)-like protein/PAS domain S-box-containing protein